MSGVSERRSMFVCRDELSLLEAHLGEIVAELAPGTVLVELGCGDGSKTVTLLRRLLERDGAGGVTYCGIDCSAEALQQMRRTLQATLPALGMDSVALVEAEYVEGVRRARERFPDAPLAILFLGSSIGNFTHPEAVQLLCQLREVAGERVVLMLGCDLMKAADTLHAAYNDSAGVTDAFIKNGMRHALRSVGHPSAERDDAWDYEVVVNAEEEQVEMYLVARESVPDVFPGVTIARGERVLMEISRKFTSSGLRALYFEAGFCHQVSSGSLPRRACLATARGAPPHWARPWTAGHLGQLAAVQPPAAAVAARGPGAELGGHRPHVCLHQGLDRPTDWAAPPLPLLLRPRCSLCQAPAAARGGKERARRHLLSRHGSKCLESRGLPCAPRGASRLALAGGAAGLHRQGEEGRPGQGSAERRGGSSLNSSEW